MSTATAPLTGKNAAGENVTVEIPIPDANSAAAWNEAMQSGAAKEGLQIEGVTEKPAAAAAATADTAKPGDDKTVYRATLNVNGNEMVFEGPDPAKVLEQYTAAVQAAQLATPTQAQAAQQTETKKPELSAADMFDVGTKLISGDASGLDTLLEKSGALDRWFEKQGISVEQIKAATQKTQSDTAFDALTTAKNEFIAKVKAGEIDFPGGAQNEKMMGIMLARVQAEDKTAGKSGAFTLDTFVRAYDLMKKEGLVFPAEKPNTQQTTTTETTKKKEAPGSTAIGVGGGGREQNTTQQAGARPKIELDMTQMSSQQFSQAYNAAIDQGYKVGVDLFIKQ